MGAAREALSLSAVRSSTWEPSTASAGSSHPSFVLLLDHCCPSLWFGTWELRAGRPQLREALRPHARSRGTGVGCPGVHILHPRTPSWACSPQYPPAAVPGRAWIPLAGCSLAGGLGAASWWGRLDFLITGCGADCSSGSKSPRGAESGRTGKGLAVPEA